MEVAVLITSGPIGKLKSIHAMGNGQGDVGNHICKDRQGSVDTGEGNLDGAIPGIARVPGCFSWFSYTAGIPDVPGYSGSRLPDTRRVPIVPSTR